MSHLATPYPQPERNDFNAPMLDAWTRGELCLQQCKACHHKVYFPRLQCPECWSAELEWKALSGRGKIVSFAIVHKHVHASFAEEAPSVFAEILLDEGWPMLARVIADPPGKVKTGMQVELVPAAQAGRFPLPTFQLRA